MLSENGARLKGDRFVLYTTMGSVAGDMVKAPYEERPGAAVPATGP
jgi:hypothetical protein